MQKAGNMIGTAFFSLACVDLEHAFKSARILQQHLLKSPFTQCNFFSSWQFNVTSLHSQPRAPCVNLLMNADSCH